MHKFYDNRQKILVRLGIAVVFALALVNLQSGLMLVSANVLPIGLNLGYLNFGTVFPGQNLSNIFTAF